MESTDLYETNSPAALRSPLKRKSTNESNTPVRNRYVTKNGYRKNLNREDRSTGQASEESFKTEIFKTERMEDGIDDDDRALDQLEQELLNDEFGRDPVAAEIVKVEVVEVDNDDLDILDVNIDESSNQSWATRTNVWEKTQPTPSVKTVGTSTSPIGGSSGRTTPDNEIQPPLKKGRESFSDTKGFRTSNRNVKREYTRKREETKRVVEKETDEVVIARRQERMIN